MFNVYSQNSTPIHATDDKIAAGAKLNLASGLDENLTKYTIEKDLEI